MALPRGRMMRGHQLTGRDLDILRWITRHGVVTTEHVARRFFFRPERGTLGLRAARRRLTALEDIGLVVRQSIWSHFPELIRVTRMGAGLAELGIGPAPLIMHEARHTITVVGLSEYLLHEHPGAQLITERELRVQRYRERRAGVRQTGWGRCPDAVLRIPSAEPGAKGVTTVAIEVDRVRKDIRSMEAMIHAHDEELEVDVVWWYVERIHLPRITQIVRSLHGESRYIVKEIPQWLA